MRPAKKTTKGQDLTQGTAKEALREIMTPNTNGMAFLVLTRSQIKAIYDLAYQVGKNSP